MPFHPFQTNFSSGELSPMLLARTDLEKYANSAACLQNFVVAQHGGAFRRAGLIYVANAKSTDYVVLHEFIFNQNEAYVLEFGNSGGNGYIRIFQNRAPLRFASSSPATTLTLSALTGDITVTTGSVVFTDTATDAGRTITANDGGVAVILTVSSGTSATARVLVDFSTTLYASGLWTITGSKVEVATTYAQADLTSLRFAQQADTLYIAHPSYPVQKLVRSAATTWTLSNVSFQPPPSTDAGILPLGDLTLSATSGFSVTATSSSAAFVAADVNKYIKAGSGRAAIRTYVSTTQVTVDIFDPFTSTTWVQGSWTLFGSPFSIATPSADSPKFGSVNVSTNIASFRSSDVGRFIHINGGILKIGTVTDSQNISAVVVKQQDPVNPADLAAAAGSWTLEDPAWSTNLGFPAVVCFHEQRLFFAATANQPTTFWGSITGDYENFAGGTEGSDSVEFTAAADQVNAIRWMKSETYLVMGTQNNEFKVYGGSENAITPSTVIVESLGATGSDWFIDPIRINTRIIFVQRGGRKIRELAYSYEQDRYIAPDLTVFSEHLFRDRLNQIAYVRTPDPYILATSTNGQMMFCSYNREEGIVAWSPMTTGGTSGFFESMAIIPNSCGTSDEVWVSMKRTINGATVRTIEFFEGSVPLDCASMYSGAETNSLRGFSYLANEPVVAYIENNLGTITIETPTVSSTGVVTLSASGSTIFIGYGFVLNLKTLRLEVAGAGGTQQTRLGKIHSVGIRFLCSNYALCNGQVVEGLSGSTTLFTGDKFREGVMGWDRKSQVTISLTANQPYKLNVLGISPVFTPSEP